MVGIVLGILAALVTGAVLAFIVLKHLRKQKKGKVERVSGVNIIEIVSNDVSYLFFYLF